MADEQTAIGAEVLAEETKVNPEANADANQNGGENADPQGTQNDADVEHKRLGGWQRKIQKQERTIEFLTQELLKRNAEPEPKKVDPEPQEPDPEKFETTLEYLKAVRAYDRATIQRELAQKLEEREQKVTQKTVEQKRADSFQAKVAKFSKEHPDFDGLVSDPDLPISQRTLQTAQESEFSAEILYHLAQNPEEAARIHRLPEREQEKAIWKLEARLETQQSTAAIEAETPEPAVSKAPPPITPIKRMSDTRQKTVYDDDLPYAEFVKLRNAKKTR